MKIKNIKINAYGTLQQKEINLGENINIIHGKNESGKSTLLNFIKSSFFGITRTKNKRDISDFEKYKPWHTEEFSGRITYQLDNQEEYQVYRDFKKKTPKIYNERLEDITDQFEIDKKDGNRFFVEQTNLEEDMFLSTIVSMQGETKLTDQDQAILIQKLANLAGSGNDNISYKKIIEKLNKKQLEEIGTERTLERPINLVHHQIKEYEQEIKELKILLQRRSEIEEEKQQIKNKIQEKEIKIKAVKEIENYLKENEIEKEKINIKRKEKKEINELIENLQKEINTKKEEKKKNKTGKTNGFLNTILILVFIAFLLGAIFFDEQMIKAICLGIMSFDLILIVVMNFQMEKKRKKVEEERRKEIENLRNKMEYLENNEKSIQKTINEAERAIDEKTDQKINEMCQKYDETFSKPEIYGLFEKEENSRQNNKITEEINAEKVRDHSLEYQLKTLQERLEELPKQEEKLANLYEEREELIGKNEVINLAKDWVEKAYEEMQKSITPKLTDQLSKNIAKISGGKYQKVVINSENKMQIEDEKGQYIPIERLSIGTIDQMYLALRLSMINEISSEKMPIILDETFAYFDEERLKNILTYLSIGLKNNQVIILTCSNRERKIMEELGQPYQYIELSK